MNQPVTPSHKRMSRLRDAVSEEPDSPVAHARLGSALMQNGAAREAVAELRKAVDLDPDFFEAWVNLGGVLLSVWDFDGCIAANERALESDPDLLEAHFNKGLGHLYRNQPEEMLRCFERVIEIDPNHPGGRYHLAVALLAVGNHQKARAQLDVAVNLGYAPQPEFLKAMDKANRGKQPLAAAVDTNNGSPKIH